MMVLLRRARRASKDSTGSVLIEFAVIAPLLIAMIIGVFQVGLQMQNYNAMRSAMSDASRGVIIEYQTGNELTAPEIETAAYAIAVTPPYMLDGDKLDIDVLEVASEIADARKFEMTFTYQPENFLGFYGIDLMTLSYTRPIYVAVAP